MENTRIHELTVNQDLLGYYLVRESSLREGANGCYLDLMLGDRTGSVGAKLWQCKAEDADTYQRGRLVKVMARMTEYRGKLQMNIHKIRLVEPEDGIQPEDYMPAAPLDPGEMYAEVLAFADKIRDPGIAGLTRGFLAADRKPLQYYPAAKFIHHAVRSGLLYHMVRMLRSAEALSGVYGSLDTDLLYAGIILHDLEKLREMESDESGTAEYTVEGELLGHLVMGVKRIDAAARETGLDAEVSLLLQHLVLSHHQRPEFGSPKPPMIPEAEALHYLDMLDARVFTFEEVRENQEPGTLSERVFALDNRRVYRPRFRPEDPDGR